MSMATFGGGGGVGGGFCKYRAMHDVSFVCLSVCLCLYVMDSSGGQRSQPILMKLDW